MSRQAEIVDYLAEVGFASVDALATRFGVTPSTIRRDLADLERSQLVQRTHGGALAMHNIETPFEFKEALHSSEKQAIGAAMADRILDGQTVLLDSGSTTLEVARHLHAERLTVVTNDLRIGLEVAERQSGHLVFIGGELLPNVYTMWGPASIAQLQTLRVNVAVFGADAVLDDGIYNTTSYELEIKRLMHSIAGESFFVADSSKFQRDALFRVFGFDSCVAGFSDASLSPILAAKFPVPIIRV